MNKIHGCVSRAASTGPTLKTYDDALELSISAYSTYMAVGAPSAQPYLAFPRIDCVAVYIACC